MICMYMCVCPTWSCMYVYVSCVSCVLLVCVLRVFVRPTCVPDLLCVACQIGSLLLSYEVRVGDPELQNYKLNHCLRMILDLLAVIQKY